MRSAFASPSAVILWNRGIQILAPILVAFLAVALSLVMVALAGKSPIDALQALLQGAFGSKNATAATLSRMVPLILVALGWIVAFSAKRVSIGFEGQILAGGAGAAIAGLSLAGLPASIHLPVAVLSGVLAGAIWVALPAFMWARNGVHEIISTLLMNLIALEMVGWLVRGPLQEDRGSFARTNAIESTALWPELLTGTRLHWDITLVMLLVFLTALVLRKTTMGLGLRFVGSNPVAARYQGVRPVRASVLALLFSGGFAGLAGSSLVLAQSTTTMSPTFSAGYGFEGIVVALLVRNNPIAVIPAAFLFAVLRQGSGLLEARVGVSSAVIVLSLGTIVILMSISSLLLDRLKMQTNLSEAR